MKKIIFALALITTLQGLSQTFSRTTFNGGENGYYYSSVHVDDGGNVTLVFENHGYEKAVLIAAPFENMVYSKVFQEKAVDFALEQIELGNLRGRILIMNEEGKRFRLRWKADRKNTENSTIKMNPVKS